MHDEVAGLDALGHRSPHVRTRVSAQRGMMGWFTNRQQSFGSAVREGRVLDIVTRKDQSPYEGRRHVVCICVTLNRVVMTPYSLNVDVPVTHLILSKMQEL